MSAPVRVLLVLALTLSFSSWAPLTQAAKFNLNLLSALTLCGSLNASPDVNNTVALGFPSPLSFACTTTKSVTITGTVVSNCNLNFDTSGFVYMQDINFQDSTSITISNAARLTMTNIRFTQLWLGSGGLVVSNVGEAVLDRCSFSGRKPSVGPASFDSCGSVVVRDTTFYSNTGGIRANSVASLSVIDSTFAFNIGSAAHALSAINSNVTVSGSSFMSNGNLFKTATPLIAVTGGGLVMAASQVSLNWGATLALTSLVGASSVTGSTFGLNFNSPSGPLISVSGCGQGFRLLGSTISYNLGGGLYVENCEAEVSHTKVWAQSGFGALCGNLGTINAQRASIYRNGWTFVLPLFSPSHFVDAACMAGCNGLRLYGEIDACANATDIVRGYNVSCKLGLNKCSQCQQAPLCTDCNGLPFGNATQEMCDRWNTLKSSGARVDYNGTAPRCELTATPAGGSDQSASMALQYDAVTVYYFNTSSNAEQALYRFPINDSDYTRSRGNMTNDQFCINYERVLDNGAGLLLQQCLFDVEQSVLFGNQTLTITVSLSNMVSFDNQTRNYTDIDIATRRVAIELSLRMSQAGVMGAVPVNATYLEALRFVGGSFDMAMELPNYAIFNDNDTSTFAYSFNASSMNTTATNKTTDYKLVLEFTGAFDTVYYDPQFGLLLGSGTFHTTAHTHHRTRANGCVGADGKGNDGASDDGILLQILVPVLVGSALVVVVLFAIGFASWLVWKKRQTNRGYRDSMVNFGDHTASQDAL